VPIHRKDIGSSETQNVQLLGRFPMVQIAEMPKKMRTGYYVSTTGWMENGKSRWDPHAYLDEACRGLCAEAPRLRLAPSPATGTRHSKNRKAPAS
jgi:hypothetical protein